MATTATATAAPALYPALFVCHGGGPLPLLGDPDHLPLIATWKQHAQDLVARYGKPRVIAVVTAHYNTATPEVGSHPAPPMWYDYYGFPAAGYQVTYKAPGSPPLAERMVQALRAAGLPADANPKRPYDHGVFVPLLAMFPEADIPVVPISVLQSDDPKTHVAMGAALRPFRAEGVFFFGSGATMHHFGNFHKKDAGKTFGDALTEALTKHPEWSQAERRAALEHVEAMPGFSEAQPDGAHEHLMPLLTLFGTSEGPAKEVANLPFYAANVRHYLFEG